MLRQTAAIFLAAALFAPAIVPASAPALAEPPAGTPAQTRPYDFSSAPASRFMRVQTQFGADMIAGAFESALVRSRNNARANSKPIPDDIRKALSPFYSDEILDSIRYSVGDVTVDGLAGFAIRNGNAAAVTLIDTIVFKQESYVTNLPLWAHEVHHVEQYAEWGVNGFAARYAFGWDSVESEARQRASDYVIWYREQMNLTR